MAESKIKKEMELRFPCELAHLNEMRSFIVDFCSSYNIPQNYLFELQLAIDEACINAIDHGSACKKDMEILIRCTIEGSRLIIIIKDFGGKTFDPEYFERLAYKKTWGKGGRGIRIISQIMDEVMYIFSPTHSTTLCMIKNLPEGI